MQGTIRLRNAQLRVGALGHELVIVSIIALAIMGQVVPEQAGWVLGDPGPTGVLWRRERSRGGQAGTAVGLQMSWPRLVRSGQIALLRSLLWWGLWQLSGQVGPHWLWLWPWALWAWRSVGLAWPGVRRRASWDAVEQGLAWGQRWLTLGYAGLVLASWLQQGWGGWRVAEQPVSGHADALPRLLGGGCLVCGSEAPRVTVERQADGGYQATVCGHFRLQVAGDSVFRKRLLLLFLGLLDVPGPQRKGRRTRDGRTPFVTEMQLGEWFGIAHPHVSRLYKDWLNADWANLLSLCSAEVLTTELVGRIVEACASFPRWGPAEVRQHLRAQGVLVSLPQVEQVFAQSGWAKLRQIVFARYDLSGAALPLRDGWLVGQLLAQVQDLLERLEAGQSASPEQRIAIADLQQIAAEAQVVSEPPLKTEPWLGRVEQVLFGAWPAGGDEPVHCPACGSTDVKPKGHKPRLKRYYDAEHQIRQVAVYRYFCCNPGCHTQTFTDMPSGLVPYS